jgi:outer membrane protein assembly factor BamC
MKSPLAVLLAFAAINLAACGGPSADLEYLDSRMMPNLEIPPDLTRVDVDSEFELPAVFSSDSPGTGGGIPVLARVDSIELKGHSDFYWLSVEEPVDNLYQLVKDFWASEGYTLAMDEPVIGVMKTNWIFNEEGAQDEDKGFFARLFSNKDLTESQDQFKTRIAQDAKTTASQIYISHRGTEYDPESVPVLVNPRKYHVEQAEWGFRTSDPELEVEMLSRLMLYLGLRQSEVEQQLANVKLFAPRASIHTDYTGEEAEDKTYILVKDEYTRTWNRTLHQLERLNIDVISAEIDTGISDKGVLLIETDIEIEKDVSGFFSFGSKMEIVRKRIKLVFSEESYDITRIDMETDDGEIDSSPEGVEFLTERGSAARRTAVYMEYMRN